MDQRPFHVRARAIQRVVAQNPSALVGCAVQYWQRGSRGSRGIVVDNATSMPIRQAQVVAYVPEDERHVLLYADRSDKTKEREVALLDLKTEEIVHEAFGNCMLEPRSVLAPLGTHTAEYSACCSRFVRHDMAKFCYEYYRVTGDSSEKRDPRHPATLCRACFAGYVAREVQSGKLYIRCPSCPRSLQMREAAAIISKELYSELVARVRAAEEKHGDDDVDMLVAAAGLQVRLCPKCSTISVE